MNHANRNDARMAMGVALAVLAALAHGSARADAVTEWNVVAADVVFAAGLPPPPANRTLAIVQTAVYEAVNAITRRYPDSRAGLQAAPDTSVEAAIAAANRAALAALVPSQKSAIDAAAQKALAAIPDGTAKAAGVALGERTAATVVAMCADDGASAPERYRPTTTPGAYVPTAIPAVPQWGQRRPWVMARPDQFRPGPPPDLGSDVWARDYNEIKAVGARNSPARTPEQTGIARFWEATAPTIYYPLVRSVAEAPGREPTQNARLFAIAATAIDDALIAVFDAKYRYGFWRPVTAIRNGDRDGNDATERDAGWLPLIDTPMHPEYPCAHCIVSGAVGAVIAAEIGAGPSPTLRTRSPTAPGIERRYDNVDDFVAEVALARIYDGVHYRTSTEVGTAMGRRIGALVAAQPFRPGQSPRLAGKVADQAR